MTAKRKPAIDKRSIYIPKPTEWDWEKISDFVVRDRLNAARATQERLQGWVDDLTRQRKDAQRELWERLPEAKLYEQRTKLALLNELGKQLIATNKLLSQVATAIEYIESHMSREVTA